MIVNLCLKLVFNLNFNLQQLEDGHTMFDYNLNINDVIQLMVKQVLSENNTNNTPKKPPMATTPSQASDKENAQVILFRK